MCLWTSSSSKNTSRHQPIERIVLRWMPRWSGSVSQQMLVITHDPMNLSLTLSGATTFRLKVKGLTIFLDTWLERPSSLPTFLKIDDVDECDYIFISHAHFDQ